MFTETKKLILFVPHLKEFSALEKAELEYVYNKYPDLKNKKNGKTKISE